MGESDPKTSGESCEKELRNQRNGQSEEGTENINQYDGCKKDTNRNKRILNSAAQGRRNMEKRKGFTQIGQDFGRIDALQI